MKILIVAMMAISLSGCGDPRKPAVCSHISGKVYEAYVDKLTNELVIIDEVGTSFVLDAENRHEYDCKLKT